MRWPGAPDGLQSWVWRLMAVLLALWGGSGVVAYLLLWIFVPAAPAPLLREVPLPR